MKNNLLLLYFFFFTLGTIWAQEIETNFEVSGHGFYSENENLPFWLVSNRDGALSEATNVLFEASGRASYSINDNSSISVGTSLFFRDDVSDEFQRKELFLKYTSKWLKATLGSEAITEDKKGLSSVNDNFLLSGNARPLPGILLQSNDPIQIGKVFKLNWAIGHYELNDDRFVSDVRVHYKKLGLDWDFTAHSTLRFELEHYAQWGGNSPELGAQPDDFDAFLDVFLAKRGGDNSATTDILNAVGNHLGIYNFEYIYQRNNAMYKFYHEHPFEDGSGTALKNFPDGIWGFYFQPNTTDFTTFIDGFLLEYVQTTNQSGSRRGGSARDNYFNSGVYRSGWSYEGNILGLPFITLGPTGLRIDNNRLRAIHFGISANHKKWSFRNKISLVENIGNFVAELDPSEMAVYSMFEATYDLEKLGKIVGTFGFDYSDLTRDGYGAGLSYSYTF